VIWEDDSVTNIAQQLITNRGFTGHEHIEEVGLIHMNGRVYDQELGRFLSADPLIQAPFVTNSFNRYSYVMNNPLKYTDPTGFFTHENGGKNYNDRVKEANEKKDKHRNSDSGKQDSADGKGKKKDVSVETSQNISGHSVAKVPTPEERQQAINDALGLTAAGIAVGIVQDVKQTLNASTEVSLSSVGTAIGTAAVNVVKKKVKVASVLDKITKRNPNDIKLSHPANLSKEFSDPRNGTVGDLAKKLKEDPSLANRISPIEVAKIKGKTYSANNRRLRAFQEAKVDVNTIPASKEQVRKIKQRLQNKRK